MKISTKKISLFAASAAMLATIAARPSLAQAGGAANSATASVARFSVDIKDATLMDALRLVFVAASVSDYSIDPAAKAVRVGSLSFKNQPWRDIVRSLASLNKFRFAREGSLWVIQPRMTNMSADAAFASSTRISAKQAPVDEAFSTVMRSSAQQSPSGRSTTLPIPAPVQSNNPWTIIELQHSYAGFIALMFQGGTVIGTQETVVPAAALTSRLGGQLLTRPGYVRKDPEFKDNNSNNGNNNGGNNNNR